MEHRHVTEPRERILAAAVELFAGSGYAGTGVRQIAAAAGVNVAMIHYYFGSKAGLFKAIIDHFFERLSQTLEPVLAAGAQAGLPPEQRLREAVRELVKLLMVYRQEVKVIATEFPLELPELAEYKAQHFREGLFPWLYPVMMELAQRSSRPIPIEIVGPAMGSMVVFHFMVRPVVERLFRMEFDDAFYERFPDEIANLFLYGVLGKPEGGADKGGDQ